MNRKITSAVLVLCIVATAGLVLAQGQRRAARSRMRAMMRGPCFGAGMSQRFMNRISKELNLTPEQITKIKQIHQSFCSQTLAAREQIRTKMKQMVALWTSPTPDPAAIKSLADQIEPLRVQVRNASIDAIVQTLGVMTPEQRTKLHSLLKNRPGFGWALGCSMFGGMGMCPDMPSSSGAGPQCPLSQ